MTPVKYPFAAVFSVLLLDPSFGFADATSTDKSDAKIVLTDDDYDVGTKGDEEFDTSIDEPELGLPGSDDAVIGAGVGRSSEGGSLDDEFNVSLQVFDGIVLGGKAGAVGMETAGAGSSSSGAGLPGSSGSPGGPAGQSGSPTPGSPAGSSPGADGGASRIPPPPNSSDSQGGASSSGGGESAPGGGRSGRGSSSGQQGKAAPPEDVPDGDDDDLIARQIREAAERETDPELRDKMWDEYRKYKENQR